MFLIAYYVPGTVLDSGENCMPERLTPWLFWGESVRKGRHFQKGIYETVMKVDMQVPL